MVGLPMTRSVSVQYLSLRDNLIAQKMKIKKATTSW